MVWFQNPFKRRTAASLGSSTASSTSGPTRGRSSNSRLKKPIRGASIRVPSPGPPPGAYILQTSPRSKKGVWQRMSEKLSPRVSGPRSPNRTQSKQPNPSVEKKRPRPTLKPSTPPPPREPPPPKSPAVSSHKETSSPAPYATKKTLYSSSNLSPLPSRGLDDRLLSSTTYDCTTPPPPHSQNRSNSTTPPPLHSRNRSNSPLPPLGGSAVSPPHPPLSPLIPGLTHRPKTITYTPPPHLPTLPSSRRLSNRRTSLECAVAVMSGFGVEGERKAR